MLDIEFVFVVVVLLFAFCAKTMLPKQKTETRARTILNFFTVRFSFRIVPQEAAILIMIRKLRSLSVGTGADINLAAR